MRVIPFPTRMNDAASVCGDASGYRNSRFRGSVACFGYMDVVVGPAGGDGINALVDCSPGL